MATTESVPALIEIVEVEPQLIAMVRETVAFVDLPRAQREARNLCSQAIKAG